MRYVFTGGENRTTHLMAIAASVAAVALTVMAIIPPSVHTAHGEESAASGSTATATNYDELVGAIAAVDANQSAVIGIAGNISFGGQITVDQGKEITLISDDEACGTACSLDYSGTDLSADDYSLFNVVSGASLTIGGGTDGGNKLSFSGQKNGRLVQVDSNSETGTVVINGGAYNNNGSDSNTSGDGNIAYVFGNGNLTINGGEFANNYANAASGNTTIGVPRSGGSVVRSSGTVTITAEPSAKTPPEPIPMKILISMVAAQSGAKARLPSTTASSYPTPAMRSTTGAPGSTPPVVARSGLPGAW
jgi:hypothetical protein